MNYDSVIHQIYEASYDPSMWQDTLSAITELTQSTSSGLIYRHNLYPAATIALTHNVTEECIIDYKTKYAAIDPFFELNSKTPLGTARADHQLIPDRKQLEERCGDFFSEYMLKHDHYHIGGATLFHDEERVAAIAVQRSQQAGPWPDECMENLTKITPHLQRAFRIYTEFTRLRSREQALYVSLDRLLVGVILLDNATQIKYINPVAQKILEQSDIASIKTNKLKAYLHDENQTLYNAISQCTKYSGEINDEQSYTIGLHHPKRLNPIPLMITSIHQSNLTHHFVDPDVRVAIFITDPDSPTPISGQALKDTYGLSSTEANIAIDLANGSSPESIAELNNVSIHTVRNQIKSIFNKTNTSRQNALVKLILTNSAANAT